MRVKHIKQICEYSQESEVIVTDGLYDVVCFSQPCSYTNDELIKETILCTNSSQVVRSDCKYKLERLNRTSYDVSGKLLNKIDAIVQVGNLLIELETGSIPGDIEEGEYISFISNRFDI